MKKAKVLSKVAKVILTKERLSVDPVEIKTRVEKARKILGISKKDFCRVIGPIIKNVMRKAEKAYLKG